MRALVPPPMQLRRALDTLRPAAGRVGSPERAGAQPRSGAVVTSTLPLASSACSARYAAGAGAVSVVSKPLRGLCASGTSSVGEAPPSSCHEAVRVSPFQLT